MLHNIYDFPRAGLGKIVVEIVVIMGV